MSYSCYLLLLVTFVSFCGCRAQTPTGDTLRVIDRAAAPTGEFLVFTPGETFYLPLPSLSGAGYQWQLDTSALGDVAALDSLSYYLPPERNGEQQTAGREEIFHFRATRPGEASLRLDQVRPFDPGRVRDSVRLRILVR